MFLKSILFEDRGRSHPPGDQSRVAVAPPSGGGGESCQLGQKVTVGEHGAEEGRGLVAAPSLG